MVSLQTQPQTEREYWEAIYELGGMIFYAHHDLADGRIKDPDGRIERGIQIAHEQQNQLLSEIQEKFGVVLPENHAPMALTDSLPELPEGKVYYRDWYNKIQTEVATARYGQIICSACPFSRGIESFINRGGEGVPCSVFPGILNSLSFPYQCGMTESTFSVWTQTELITKIHEQSGDEGLFAFLAKKQELMNKATP